MLFWPVSKTANNYPVFYFGRVVFISKSYWIWATMKLIFKKLCTLTNGFFHEHVLVYLGEFSLEIPKRSNNIPYWYAFYLLPMCINKCREHFYNSGYFYSENAINQRSLSALSGFLRTLFNRSFISQLLRDRVDFFNSKKPWHKN